MAKFTKKWLKDFEKKYKQTLTQFEELEKEFKDMRESNPDSWELDSFTTYETLSFTPSKDKLGTLNVYHHPKDEEKEEYIEIGVDGNLCSFAFVLSNLKQLIDFRNDLTKAIDEFERPLVKEKNKPVSGLEECKEDMTQEEWDAMEDQEWTVQVSRTCVQKWTMTVMAKTSCEAEWKAQSGEYPDDVSHDENDELDDYGDQTYECID
jgi:hypothetical protein